MTVPNAHPNDVAGGDDGGRDDSSIHPAEGLVERVIGFLTQQQGRHRGRQNLAFKARRRVMVSRTVTSLPPTDTLSASRDRRCILKADGPPAPSLNPLERSGGVYRDRALTGHVSYRFILCQYECNASRRCSMPSTMEVFTSSTG